MLCGFDGGAATMTTTMTATTMTMWLSNFLHPSVSHLSEWGIPGVCRVWTEMLNQIRQMKFEEIDDEVDYELLNCFNGWDRRLGEGIQRMGMAMCVLKSVWPDLVNFATFAKKIWILFGILLRVYLVIGIILNPTFENGFAIGKIFIAANGKILSK